MSRIINMQFEAAPTTSFATLDAYARPSVGDSSMTARSRWRRTTGKLLGVHSALGTSIGQMGRLFVDFARLSEHKRVALHLISLRENGRLAAEIEELHTDEVLP